MAYYPPYPGPGEQDPRYAQQPGRASPASTLTPTAPSFQPRAAAPPFFPGGGGMGPPMGQQPSFAPYPGPHLQPAPFDMRFGPPMGGPPHFMPQRGFGGPPGPHGDFMPRQIGPPANAPFELLQYDPNSATGFVARPQQQEPIALLQFDPVSGGFRPANAASGSSDAQSPTAVQSPTSPAQAPQQLQQPRSPQMGGSIGASNMPQRGPSAQGQFGGLAGGQPQPAAPASAMGSASNGEGDGPAAATSPAPTSGPAPRKVRCLTLACIARPCHSGTSRSSLRQGLS